MGPGLALRQMVLFETSGAGAESLAVETSKIQNGDSQ